MILEKPAQTEVPIHDLIAKRWSPRAFDAHRPVSREHILALIEAARWAPSCRGEEPWRYLVFDKTTDAASWEKALNCLDISKWAKNAPLLFLATVESKFNHNGLPNRWAQYDCGAASENICLQAFHLGLVAHQMGGIQLTKTHELLGLPIEITCMVMIAIGYQAPLEVLDKETQTKELAERTRQPLEEKFFEGTWKTPFKK